MTTVIRSTIAEDRRRISAARIRELEAAIQEAMDFIDRYVDVIDGPDGPEPNEAMQIHWHLYDVLEKK